MNVINTKTGERLYISSSEMSKLTGLKLYQIMYRIKIGNLPDPILMAKGRSYENNFFTFEIKDWIKINYPDKIEAFNKFLMFKK